MTRLTDDWIIRRAPRRSGAAVRLFCFHHAGGGASAYQAWPSLLGDQIELCALQTPGRENLFGLSRHRDVSSLLSELTPRLRPWLSQPFAFFGHSLGALVAFATTHQLLREGGPLPRLLILSACRPPHAPREEAFLSDVPEERLLEAIRELGSDSASALANAELREILLPILRDDLAMAETFPRRPWPPLPRPILVFGGSDDRSAPLAQLSEWKSYTRAEFDVQIFPGGHFYTEENKEALTRRIRERLTPAPPFAAGAEARA
ncbi:MAG TPA: alpha/beta fold hydrolase [Methylocystis sp.]|nr:alpha/beta fold hydrolase [Methylocystis sp.]HXZ15265.1 alpha/beta fold hydrolase [Roseiarcus sp.]